MRLTLAFALILSVPAIAVAQPDYAQAVRDDYATSLATLWDHLHRHPELSFQETRTAAKIAEELRSIAGIDVTEGVGGTGIVGVLRNGPGRTVLIRADMDGLPVEERSGLPNASTARQVGLDGVEVPVMHACGHDVHMTSLIGTARRLAAMTNRWSGTVVFVVQPAEERLGGAKAMLDDGLYQRFPKPDYAIAFHVTAQMGTGLVSASEHIQYSSSDSLDIVVHGVGAHGAAPHTGKDPVYIASQIVVALQGIISRERAPLDPAVITVGAFHAGNKHNIISERADLQVTVRSNNEKTRAFLLQAIERVAHGVARTNGMPEDRLPTVTRVAGTPTTINDAALVRRLNAVMERTFGARSVVPFVQASMGAEDFAYFVAPGHNVRGYYFAVGGTPPQDLAAEAAGGPPVASHHSPLFRIDPKASVVMGTVATTAAVLDLLNPNGPNLEP